MDFEIHYSFPDETLAGYDFLEDDQQMLIDIEKNIANIQRKLTTESQEAHSSERNAIMRSVQDKRKTTMKTVRNLMRSVGLKIVLKR